MLSAQALALSVFCLAALLTQIDATSPGFRTTITDKGLNYVREVGVPILVKYLSDLSIPDIKGKADSPIGKIDYELKKIKTSNFEIPSSSLSVDSGKGVSVEASSAELEVEADWHYAMESWPHTSDSGSCEVKVSDVKLKFVITVGADSKGHATLSASDCQCEVGHLDIKFHGGASWLYNLFAKYIEGYLKKTLEDQVCSAGKEAIDHEGSKALESLPVTVVLDKYAEIDYRLLSSPTYTSSYIETNHKGEFFLRSNPTEAPFSVPSLPSVTSSDHMMYLWLTDYMANTAGFVYEESGELHFTITPAMVPPSMRKTFALNTTVFKPYVPQLYNKCPGCPMTLQLNNSAPTTLKMASSGITGALPGTIEVDITDMKKNITSQACVLNLLVHFTVTLTAAENNSKAIVKGEAKYLSADLSVASSNIGKFSVSGLENATNALCILAVIPFINHYAGAGIPLPVVDGVSLVNPEIQLGEDYVRIATDFNYKPTFIIDYENTRVLSRVRNVD